MTDIEFIIRFGLLTIRIYRTHRPVRRWNWVCAEGRLRNQPQVGTKTKQCFLFVRLVYYLQCLICLYMKVFRNKAKYIFLGNSSRGFQQTSITSIHILYIFLQFVTLQPQSFIYSITNYCEKLRDNLISLTCVYHLLLRYP